MNVILRLTISKAPDIFFGPFTKTQAEHLLRTYGFKQQSEPHEDVWKPTKYRLLQLEQDDEFLLLSKGGIAQIIYPKPQSKFVLCSWHGKLPEVRRRRKRLAIK